MEKSGQVLKLFTTNSIATDTPFQDVQATAFAILERQKLEVIAERFSTNAKFTERKTDNRCRFA